MKQNASSPISNTKPPRLRVGLRDVSAAEFADAVNERMGKQRVTIMLDSAVLAFFRAKAGERGYQTLINQALHDAISDAQMEATLRRVSREELHGSAS